MSVCVCVYVCVSGCECVCGNILCMDETTCNSCCYPSHSIPSSRPILNVITLPFITIPDHISPSPHHPSPFVPSVSSGVDKKTAEKNRKECVDPGDGPTSPVPTGKSSPEVFQTYNDEALGIFQVHEYS